VPPTIPESTKISLGQRLRERQRERWPSLATVQVRFRGRFAYVNGQLDDGEVLPLCRLRYAGSASRWGFAIYLASRAGYLRQEIAEGWQIEQPDRTAAHSGEAGSAQHDTARAQLTAIERVGSQS